MRNTFTIRKILFVSTFCFPFLSKWFNGIETVEFARKWIINSITIMVNNLCMSACQLYTAINYHIIIY